MREFSVQVRSYEWWAEQPGWESEVMTGPGFSVFAGTDDEGLTLRCEMRDGSGGSFARGVCFGSHEELRRAWKPTLREMSRAAYALSHPLMAQAVTEKD
jgi:hypothetical protein